MLKFPNITLLGITYLFLGAVHHVAAQPVPRAGVVDEEALEADAGDAYFNRGKNIFDLAQRERDLEIRREQYLKAAEIFTGYLNEFRNHANAEAAWFYLGSSYYQAGMIDEAKRNFATLMNRHPKSKYSAAAAYTLAADHYQRREYAFAAPLFERFAANSARPEDKPKGYLFAGRCYHVLGRNEEALASFNKVIADPASALFRDEAELAIGHIHFKTGKLAEAFAQFEKVAKSNAVAKYRGEGALHAAITATKLERTDEAEKYLGFILNTAGMEEFRPSAQIALMENFYIRREYQKVIDIYRKSTLKAEGEKEAARVMIAARATLKLKRPADASELFREVERLVPPENDLAFQASYYRLHCFFEIEGRHVVDQVDAFLQIYSRSRPKDPRIHTAMLMKAETQFSFNKIADAAKTYSQIDPALLSPTNLPGFHYQRGWVLSEAGDPQGAIRSLTEFITNHADDKRIHPALAKRAKAYTEIGESAKAVADYDRISSDTTAPQDLAALAWLESARTRRKEGDRKEGDIANMIVRYKGLLEKVSDLDDNLKAEANYWIGWGLVKTNKPRDAADYLNLARQLSLKDYGKHAGLLLSLSYFSAQDPAKLAAEINLAIEKDYVKEIPEQALRWAGMQAFNSGDYTSTAKFLEVISNNEDPRSTPKEVWRYLAKAHIEVGEFAQALPCIANILDVEDSPAWKADALLDRARALYGLKRYSESRKAVDEAMELRPQGRTSARLRIVSGDNYVEDDKLGQAAADYLNVIQFHEDADLKPLAIHKYIQLLEKQGKTDEVNKYKAQLKSEFPDWKAP
jgi:tetratricopeptide (TPR) repeat protein